MARAVRVSWDDERLALFRDLTDHQLRNRLDPARGIMIAESEIAVRRCLELGAEPVALALDERRLDLMSDVVEALPDEVDVLLLEPDDAERLTGYRVTRGVLCALRRPALPSVADAIAGGRRVLVMEGIVDTTNVGALFRCAAALGVDAIVVSPDCCDPLTRRAVRTSMGNVLAVTWARAEGAWPGDAYAELRAAGYHVAALALREGATELGDGPLASHERLALVVGTEGGGLTDAAIEAADEAVIIPMSGEVDSLNVGVAAGIALWELRPKAE